MRLPQFVCVWLPYLHRDYWGVGKALHAHGYKKNTSSKGIAWGFGHPQFKLDFQKGDGDRFISTCTRCGRRTTS